MLSTLSLIRREFTAYFLSPIAYVVIAVFLAVTGHLFYLTLNQLTASGPKGVEFPMQLMLGDSNFWLVFLFIPPLLTMRLLAEERGSGTLEMLMTAPLHDWQVVLAKYAACFAFYVVMWLPTLLYLPVLMNLGQPVVRPIWTPFGVATAAGVAAFVLGLLLCLFPTGTWLEVAGLILAILGGCTALAGGWCHYRFDAEHMLFVPVANDSWSAAPSIATSYLGVILAGGMFLALGLFVSSLVRSQMVAALVALFLSLGFIVAGIWRPEIDSGSMAYRVLFYFSVPLHFARDFSRGVVDTRHIVLYVSVALFCLFLTVRGLESRRWR